MTAPRLKLVLWMLLITVPLATIAGLNRGFAPIALLLIGFVLISAGVDFVLGYGRYRDLKFSLPETVRAIRDQRAELEVRVQSSFPHHGILRLAVLFPDGLESEAEPTNVLLTRSSSERLLLFPFMGTSRGSCLINRLYFDWHSPFGFWIHRSDRTVRCEVRIYPNLIVEGKQIAHFLKRGAMGIHAHPQVGRGREFEKLRTYERGDGFDEIHWKATAKQRFPVTKVFQLERSKEVYLAIDTSRLSARPLPDTFTTGRRNTNTTHLDRAISTALLFCATAERQGDRFGFISFSDKVDHLIKARNGSSHFNLCRDLAISLTTQTVAPDFTEIAATLKQRINGRSLIVFLTSLDDPVVAEDFVLTAGLLSRQHVILAVMIAPHAVQSLFSEGTVQDPDEIYAKLGGHLTWVKLQNLRRTLVLKGVQFHVVANHHLGLKLVSSYMDLKRRQIL